jgi:hypothetical protein
MWRGNFNKLVRWPEVVQSIGAPGSYFHDLRHTGNTIAARTGASTRELMARMGHDSAQAAIVYQHAAAEADRAIAEAVDKVLKAERRRTGTAAGRPVDASGSWMAPQDDRLPDRQRPRAGEPPCDLGLVLGAGDGNRTRTVSLGS